MSDWLSSELLCHADSIEEEALRQRSIEERDQYWKNQTLFEGFVKVIIDSRETLSSSDLSVFAYCIPALNDQIVSGILAK